MHIGVVRRKTFETRVKPLQHLDYCGIDQAKTNNPGLFSAFTLCSTNYALAHTGILMFLLHILESIVLGTGVKYMT